MGVLSPHLNLFDISQCQLLWKLFAIASVALPVVALSCAVLWSFNGYSYHPLAKKLAAAGRGQRGLDNWRAVATSVNIEFRRYDKFACGSPGRQVFVTDNWLIQTCTYSVNVAHQSDVLLSVDRTIEHRISHESGPLGSQSLCISVRSITTHQTLFTLLLNSDTYKDLQEKISAPIRAAQSVMIRSSISERFIDAFVDCVSENRKFESESDLESCLGCMQVTSNCKIIKNCDATGCGVCFCRPMWCLNCLARWFSSRQMQEDREPETWLSQKSPCPTCRTPFCILDVCPLRN